MEAHGLMGRLPAINGRSTDGMWPEGRSLTPTRGRPAGIAVGFSPDRRRVRWPFINVYTEAKRRIETRRLKPRLDGLRPRVHLRGLGLAGCPSHVA